ncbi:MAG: PQQ-like beta-propeller repeat protein, partial [Gemmataceae bacterium]|nr:PQQ-like beta-propeller repeat protein [Gemmataceae bacterium]
RCEVVCATTAGLAAGNQGVKDEKYKSKTDADIVWRLDMIGELGVFPHNLATCSPLIAGDLIFVITSNGVDEGHTRIPKPDAPSFIAVDKKTGKVKWTDKSPGKRIIHGQWSNPVYAEAGGKAQVIFPGGDGWLYSFDPPTGKLLWKFDCNPKDAKYILGGRGMRNDFVCTPVVVGNLLYIGVGQDPEHKKGVGHLWCIDITKEPKNKERDLSPFSPKGEAPSDFDPKDPKNKDSGLVWHYGGATPEGHEKEYFFGRTMSTCAVHDGLCYAADFDGSVYCFDAKTGNLHWEHAMGKGAETWASPYWVDGHVYIGNEKGQMFVFKHGTKKELVKTVNMQRGCKIRSTPVALNGVLYVVTENPCKLWAIKQD